MKTSLTLIRVLFVILSFFFMTTFMVSLPIGTSWQKLLFGIAMGSVFSALLFSTESLFKKYSLKAFNKVILGLLLGCLMGYALTTITNAVLQLSQLDLVFQLPTVSLIKMCLFLIGAYLGTCLTIRSSQEIFLSIPFIRLNRIDRLKKDLLVDRSALADPRMLDLAATGLLDHALIIPRFIESELYCELENEQDRNKYRARRSIETIKKLQNLPSLGLRFEESDCKHLEGFLAKLMYLARINEAQILSAELSSNQVPSTDEIRIINLQNLSFALKPLMNEGESIHLKIQRFGKEPNQGVGYLDDGTMVVVNGGGDYIGETIEVQVLSVKHTSSGRMIFCNTMEELQTKGNQVQV